MRRCLKIISSLTKINLSRIVPKLIKLYVQNVIVRIYIWAIDQFRRHNDAGIGAILALQSHYQAEIRDKSYEKYSFNSPGISRYGQPVGWQPTKQ